MFHCCQRDSEEKYLEKITLVKSSTSIAPEIENASKEDGNACMEDDMTAEVFCLLM